MAANPPQLLVEDQTDEDFFDKLVDEDSSAPGSRPIHSDSISKSLSNLSLNGTKSSQENDAPVSAEELVTRMAPSEVPMEKASNAVLSLGSSVTAGCAGTKGTSVKVVQWSAFHIDPQQSDAGGFGFDLDFLADNADVHTDSQKGNTQLNSFLSEQPVLDSSTSIGSTGQQDAQVYSSANEQSTDWENAYPGWKYDYATGQWYQVDGFDVSMSASQSDSGLSGGTVGANQSSCDQFCAVNDKSVMGSLSTSYLQQTNSVLETIAEECTTSSVANWNQDSEGSINYPSNMLFDPQYPGWYYDTNTQQWYTMESYTQSAAQHTATTLRDHLSREMDASSGFMLQPNYSSYNEAGRLEHQTEQGLDSRDLGGDLGASMSTYAQGDWNTSANKFAQQSMWPVASVDKRNHAASFYPDQKSGSFYDSTGNTGGQMDQHTGFKTLEPVIDHGYGRNTAVAELQGFVPKENSYYFTQPKADQSMQAHISSHFSYGHEHSVTNSQPMFRGGNASYSQLPRASSEGRSSAGRPLHALVTFGFGGKLIIVKDGTKLDYGSQGTVGGQVSILNLMDVLMDKSDGYFRALCQQSFPGPLVGGNAATKDVNKWVDDRIMSCESSSMDLRKGELLKLLLSLLKISYQHYGKLRSAYSTDPSVQEPDGPDAAVTKLFASARRNGAQLREPGSFTDCMKALPSESQIRATAIEVQNLLVTGRRQEALQCAQDGYLWGPALVLAAQLGEKFYVETVKKMASLQLTSGSPLRTLCLLIAGQPADVFSTDSFTNSLASVGNVYQQPTQALNNGMLDRWEENLAIITANRTKDDELVILHLGDCLWKEKGEITSAHTCYLVADANFESYSDSARLCLIGADHWKCPRTYASPEAIQRTELYEYSMVLGNSQFILLPFQPYKLVYASMLAEVGKVSDSLKYCSASVRLLKHSGRSPEVEMWKSLFSSLEERLRIHQQGGYGSNLAPAKLVGKLFTSIDRSIHRIISAPPSPLPPLPRENLNGKENNSTAAKVSNSQSTMAMSSLIPSASVEAISEWTSGNNKKSMHNRSISEPDFGRSPKQALSKDSGSPDSQGKTSTSGGPSRFGRFGSQLLQKTMGWVSRSHSDRQAKLGERNKFYYDEKLKRWVEEGAEPPAEEAALPPPPTTASFQNGAVDYNINNAFKSNANANGGPGTQPPTILEKSAGTPPIPPSTNQFSARARMGVRSRYVDTFNKTGGSSTPSFQSPSIPSVKPEVPAKLFIPTAPAAAAGLPVDESQERITHADTVGEPSTSTRRESLLTSPSTSPSPSPMPRFPSVDNIAPMGNRKVGMSQNASASLSFHTRAASWSGSNTMNHIGNGIGGPTPFVPQNPLHLQTSSSSHQLNGIGNDLHEVEL